MDEMCFLKMGKDSAARIVLGRSFHQMGTVNVKVCESDSVLLWDGTINSGQWFLFQLVLENNDSLRLKRLVLWIYFMIKPCTHRYFQKGLIISGCKCAHAQTNPVLKWLILFLLFIGSITTIFDLSSIPSLMEIHDFHWNTSAKIENCGIIVKCLLVCVPCIFVLRTFKLLPLWCVLVISL